MRTCKGCGAEFRVGLRVDRCNTCFLAALAAPNCADCGAVLERPRNPAAPDVRLRCDRIKSRLRQGVK